MGTLHAVRHIRVSIHRAPQDAYDFASNPENLPKRATGYFHALAPAGYVRMKSLRKMPNGWKRI